MSLPIRVRMTAWYVALLTLIIAACGAFVLVRLRADLVGTMDAQLTAAARQIALGYHAEGAPEARDTAATTLSGEGAAAQVLEPSGAVVTSDGDAVAKAAMIERGVLSEALGGRVVHATRTLGGRRFRVVARPASRGVHPRVVVAAESTAPIDRSVHRLLVLLLLACPGAILATTLGGWWLARRALRPISRLTLQADLIGMERLADRLPVPDRRDEVARLAETLNAMLARIEAGVDEQHRLVADASHELRTPLAAMRAELEVSLRAGELDGEARAVLASTLEEVERLARTVDGLLTLARSDEGELGSDRAPLDLAELAAGALERLRPLAAGRDVVLAARLEPAGVAGDAPRLTQALTNLLDNAIKFSPSGGTVTVTTRRHAGLALAEVLDEGPGIPDHARERVFDRFYRLDESRSRATGGAGIGLSLVREIAEAHGGRAWVDPITPTGARVVLALPATRGRVADALAEPDLGWAYQDAPPS